MNKININTIDTSNNSDKSKTNHTENSEQKTTRILINLASSLFIKKKESSYDFIQICKFIKTRINVKELKTMIESSQKNFSYLFNKSKSIMLYNKTYSINEIEKLSHKLNKIIYFCYRSKMPPIKIEKSKKYFTSDSGWGCMIRCGQMIFARAIYKFLKSKKIITEEAIPKTLYYFIEAPFEFDEYPPNFCCVFNKFMHLYFEIEKTFIDIKYCYAPFNIMSNCLLGEIYDKYPGEYFSDINMCMNFVTLNDFFDIFPDLKIFSFQSSFILSKIISNCFKKIENIDNNINNKNIYTYENKQYIMEKNGLIFISVRLGLNKITEEYYSSIIEIFNCKECIGIIGGKNNKAYYFIGCDCQRDVLFYLDPHTTKNCVYKLDENSLFENYLNKTVYEISLKNMSAAFTIGFLFRNFQEFEHLINFLQSYTKAKQSPCFSLINAEIDFVSDDFDDEVLNNNDDF